MRILLVLPEAGIHRLKLGSLRISFREAPLTLTTLAALVPPELNAQITIADESVQRIPWDAAFDLVGISCLTGTAHRAYEIAKHFRACGATIVLGGVHVTLRPDEARQHADSIVRGFAEQSWPQLLRDYARGMLQPVYSWGPSELRGLPHPRRDLQKRLGYMAPHTVFATRGCRRSCDFCTVSAAGFGWCTRPVQEVIDEIRSLPSRRFVFNDVSIAEDRQYAKELFAALAPLKKKWGCLATLDIVDDDELLALMQAGGCVYLLVGLETLTQRGAAAIRKAFNHVADYRAAITKLRDHGLVIQGCFVLGLDEDDQGVFERTLQSVHDLRIDIPRFAIYTPYPETNAFQRLEVQHRILHEYWPHYDTQHVVFQPAQMSPRELDQGFRTLYRQTFTLGHTLRRTVGSRHFLIALAGNLAYRLYIRRLQRDTQRLYEDILARGEPCLT